MTTRQGFGLGLALGLTLSAGFVLGSMFTPHATAQAGAPTRWEYTTLRHGFDGGSWANTQGAQGWRFIAFDGGDSHVLIFERPVH